MISLEDAAAEAGIELHELISLMHQSGEVLVVPGSEDPRCWLWSGFERHAPDCECRFVVAHPDVQEIG